MPLTLQLVFGEPPGGSEFPGTPKALGDFLAQYFQITGGEDFTSVNFGPDTPTEENRDKPWFKTDEDGKPIGWFSWDGVAWTKQPETVKRGPTSERPEGVEGLLYFDTDINALLIFERAAWRTAAGSPGDVKFVKAATIEDALEKNPGWVEDEDARGRVIGAAGEGAGLTPRDYGAQIGEEEHALDITQIPEHKHSVPWAPYGGQFQNGSQPAGIYPIVTGAGTSLVSSNPESGTGGLSHNNMQPTVFYWALVKE
jgi:hypothetical protein